MLGSLFTQQKDSTMSDYYEDEWYDEWDDDEYDAESTAVVQSLPAPSPTEDSAHDDQ